MHSSATDPGELAKLYDKVFKDTVITCTVTFNDGTSQKRQIGIGGAVMTYEELGTQTDEPVESPEDPSQKQAYLKLQILINSLEFSFILILQIKRRMKHATEYDHNQKSVKRI